MEHYKFLEESSGSFIDRYIHTELDAFYHYAVNETGLEARSDVRPNGREQELSDVIAQYMGDDISHAQRANIAAIREGHQVVIGGQQAGLFVSPMYTIHKIISIIVMAKEQSKRLGKHIVPVFWIAGEDHDFDEVNHANIYDNESVIHRVKYYPKQEVTDSVSHVQMETEAFHAALNKLISLLDETEHTKPLFAMLSQLPDNWTEHFHKIVHELFKAYGVLFIDSHYSQLRQLERELLTWQFEHHLEIDRAFREGQDKLAETIGERQIVTDTNVHLFMQYDGIRQLLKYEAGKYVLPKSEVSFTKEEILQMIDTSPEIFSNNVVTRPLMQELVFNTLAFIGGPSEIKYWGELTQVFELADINMPVVVPRMRITYITPELLKIMTRYDITIEGLFEEGIEYFEQNFLKSKENYLVEQEIKAMQQQLDASFKAIHQLDNDAELTELARKNLEHHHRQFNYFLETYRKQIKRRHNTEMKHFNKLRNELTPGGLQERIMHPAQLLNRYGLDVFSDVIDMFETYQFNHLIIKTNE